MPRATPSVFISYRREDCPGHAGRLFDHLRARFGGDSVFMDVTDIEAGVDFTDVLQRAVGSCDVLLAVVGREWLTCTDRNGRRRLDDPNDFIRLEIGIALTRNVRVIPVLVEGAAMPGASDLPSDLEGLARRQAVELRDARWSADVDNLADVLDRVLGARTAAIESSPSQTRPGRARFWGLAAVALVAALVGVVTLIPRIGPISSAPPQTVSGAPAVAPQSAPVEPQPAPAAAPQISPEQETRTDIVPPDPRRSPPPATRDVASDRANAPGDRTTVVIHYASADDRRIAGELATALRETVNNSRYVIRTLNTSRNAGSEGQVRYSASGLSALADALAQSAEAMLSKTYGRRVAFTPLVDPRVTATSVVVVMPGRTPAPATPLPDPVITVAYAATADARTAEALANFLRTMRSGWKYSVRTEQNASSPKAGRIEYDNERMGELAQVLARDPALWISRAYGRRVVLQPVKGEKIGRDAVMLWMPSR